MFIDGEFSNRDRILYHFEGSAEVQLPDEDGDTSSIAFQEAADQGNKRGEAQPGTRFIGIKGTELNGELVATRIPFPHQFLGTAIKILFADLDAFPECRGLRVVKDLSSATRS